MMRLALGLVGGLALAFGVLKLWGLGLESLPHIGLWVVGGVLLHDAVLAPIVIAVGLAGAMLMPPWLKGPATVGAVVLVTVTLAVLPTLAGFGAQSDLPSLLDRPYVRGWVVFAGIVAIGVAVTSFLGRRHHTPVAAAD
jgi:hypothetical protein